MVPRHKLTIAGRASEMTYIVSGGALNSTHSLTRRRAVSVAALSVWNSMADYLRNPVLDLTVLGVS